MEQLLQVGEKLWGAGVGLKGQSDGLNYTGCQCVLCEHLVKVLRGRQPPFKWLLLDAMLLLLLLLHRNILHAGPKRMPPLVHG